MGVVVVARLAVADSLKIHFPWVFKEFDAHSRRHRLALIHHRVYQMSQITEIFLFRKSFHVWEIRDRGDTVDAGVEDKLGPLCRQQVGKRLGL